MERKREEIVNKRDLLKAILEKKKKNKTKTREIEALERKKGRNYFPASYEQKRLWFIQNLDTESIAYNIHFGFRIHGDLKIDLFQKAITEIGLEQEVLRTKFRYMNDELIQVIEENFEEKIKYIDLSNIDSEIIEEELKKVAEEESYKPFDLENGPLVRFILIEISPNERLFMIVIHHIIFDGWSMGIFYKSLSDKYNNLYSGNYNKSNELKIQYGDYSKWQRKKSYKEKIEKQFNYWKNNLEGIDQNTEFKTDKKRPIKATNNGDVVFFELDNETVKKLKMYSAKTNFTVNTILLSAFKCLIYKYTKQNNITIGTAVANRKVEGIENIIGFFVNTIVLSTELDGKMNCLDVLKKVRTTTLESYDNEDFPFDQLVERLNPVRDSSRNPFFQLMFNYQNTPKSSLKFKDLIIEDYALGSRRSTSDITLQIEENGDTILGFLEYNPDLFYSETIERISNQFKIILKEIISGANKKINDISIISEDEEKLILNSFNDTDLNYDREKTVVQIFEEQVEKTPNNIALLCGKEKLTYKELNDKANKLGLKLRELGIKPDDFVAISAQKSIEALVGILGIIKSGGAYVPIDPKFPKERINYILGDCKPKAVVTYNSDIEVKDVPTIDLSNTEIFEGEVENLKRVNSKNDLLYAIYTSGTTGKPKGVMIEHKSINSLRQYFLNSLKVNKTDKILQFSNLVFDGSVWDIVMALLTGSALYVVNQDKMLDQEFITKYIEDTTIMTLPPQFYKQLSTKGQRFVITAGSESSKDIVLKAIAQDGEYINAYGPTEATVCATCWKCDDKENVPDTIPIGKPIDNKKIYILDENNLCGIGMPGELCIGGEGLARGYLNRPELTAEKFIENPYSEGKIYRTGDLARWLPDGNIEYLGRIDEQVKIRGFRIELGEIENVLSKINYINDVAVVVKEESNGEKEIYSYIVSDKEIDSKEIKKEMRKELPEYMIPSYIMQIKEIPINRSGKVDKHALPDKIEEDKEEYIAPRDNIEEIVAKIFEEVIGRDRISVDSDFFEIGGHSLRATKVSNKIENETGVRVPINIIFSERTIEAIANYMKKNKNKKNDSIEKAKEKKYYKMSSTQKRMFLMWQMDKESTVYNIPLCYKVDGDIEINSIRDSLQKMIERHEILRTAFVIENEIPIQKVLNKVKADYSYEESTKEIEEIIKEFKKPFSLDKGNVIRMKIIKTKDQYYLLLDMHHIVSDGISIGIFIKEFSKLYNGEELKEPKLQYKDYSEWIEKRNLENQKEYWLRKFEDEIPIIDMPYDYKRPHEQSYEGAMTNIKLDKKIQMGVKELCNITGATEYMVLLSAFMVALNKYTRQEDIVVGSPISGRTHKDMESIIGMFVNTLAMREKPESKKSFLSFIEEVKEDCIKAYENQEFTFEELVESIDIRRDFSRNPLFDVMFELQDTEGLDFSTNNIKLEEIWGEHKISKFDFTLIMESRTDGYFVGAEYCTALFKKETIDRFLIHFKEILYKVINTPEILIGEIKVITKEEEELILNKFNDTFIEYNKENTVIDIFEEMVKKTPNSLAVVYENEKLTYEQLNAKANVLGSKLRKLGVKPNDFVGLSTERSLEMIIGILGILKAGGAYVPIDPKHPKERIQYILSDCTPKALITYNTDLKSTEIPIINLNDSNIFEDEFENIEKVNKSEDILYLIYTSGTTGNPKGVMVKHNNMVNYCLNNEKSVLKTAFKEELTNMASVTNMTFDIFGTETILSFLNGMTTFIANNDEQEDVEYLTSFIERNNIEILQTTPSRIKILLSEPEKLKQINSLKYIMVGGEEVEYEIVNKLHKYTDAVIANVYGPSETTVWSTVNELSGDIDNKNIPIGKPIANTQVYILQDLNLCGIGVPGELCIAGDGVTKGYLNKKDLTNEKYIENNFGEGKLYRTGDLARWLQDGNIEFLGRIDEQVKIRGFRIELGEIKNALINIDYINDAAVIVKEDSKGDKAIYAYLISDKVIDLKTIKKEVSEKLPKYMIPSYIMQIEKIPVNRNGKLDRKALPKVIEEIKEEYVSPRSDKEKLICYIVSEILEVKNVGLNDNFFDLGGDSMKLLRLISALRKEGFKVSFNIIKTSNNMQSLAENLVYVDDNLFNEKINKENNISIDISNLLDSPRCIEEDFKGSKLYKEIENYNENLEDAIKCNEYTPLNIQRDFLEKEVTCISSLGVEVKGEVSKEKILNIISNIIKEQAVLRTIYDSEKDKLVEITKENWDIPYFSKEEYEDIYKNLNGIFNCNELFKTNQLLSKIIVIEKSETSHLICFYVDHTLWDFMTSQILLDMIKSALVNNKNSFKPEETYYDYINRKRYNSKEVNMYDSIDNIEDKVDSYMKCIRENYSCAWKVILTKQINNLDRKEILNSPMKWILDRYNKMLNIKEISQIPFTMVHHARELKTLNTLGLYADTIPCLYDITEKELKGLEEENNLNGSYGLYKEKVPAESNIFKELNVNVIVSDSNAYSSKFENNTVKINSKYEIGHIPEEIYMYIGKDIIEIQCSIYSKENIREKEIINKVKNCFNIL